MFKVRNNRATKMGLKCVLRCARDRAPFLAKPVMQLLGAARRYCKVTSSLTCCNNVEEKFFVNFFKRM